MKRHINIVAALIVISAGAAEAGTDWQSKFPESCEMRDSLPSVYRDISLCPEYEEARREYNLSRDVASLPIYMPEYRRVTPSSEKRNSR